MCIIDTYQKMCYILKRRIAFKKGVIFIKTFGRNVIYANYTEKEFLSGTREEQAQRILKILEDTTFQQLHEQNKVETRYLIDYMYGDQDIKFKEKKTRTDINNTSVENWAYAFVDFKKTFLLGKPVKYAPINDVSNEEIITLNSYMTYEDKNALDLDLWEDVLATGRGFRYIGSTPITDDDEAPFEIINLDPWKTEVIYSSGIDKEQLVGLVETKMTDWVEKINELSGEKELMPHEYSEYTAYTRKAQFVFNNQSGAYQLIDFKPLLHNEHRIYEVYINRKRMSLIEIGKDIFDDINYVENLDLDDIEGFVNSIMVFTNAQVDGESLNSIKEYGALSIKSTEQKKASVELLQSRLKSLDTQIFYLRKLNALHNILGVPQATSDGQVNAETGKGMLTGQGFTSASVRIENETLAYTRADKKALKVILKICKANPKSIIKKLKVSDIEIKLSRDLSDNLLVKSQALLTLANANIPPEIRNQVVNLFSDSASVTKLQKAYEEEKMKVQEQLNNQMKANNSNMQKLEEENNKVEDVSNIQEQEQ